MTAWASRHPDPPPLTLLVATFAPSRHRKPTPPGAVHTRQHLRRYLKLTHTPPNLRNKSKIFSPGVSATCLGQRCSLSFRVVTHERISPWPSFGGNCKAERYSASRSALCTPRTHRTWLSGVKPHPSYQTHVFASPAWSPLYRARC